MRLEDIEKEWHVVRCSYNEDDDKITWVETYVDKLLAVAKAAKVLMDTEYWNFFDLYNVEKLDEACEKLEVTMAELEKDDET